MVWQLLATRIMESNEISHHQVRLYDYLRANPQWHTGKSISEGAGLNNRTVRAHVLKFVKLGLVDQLELYPGHRYRWSEIAEKRNKAMFQRLEQASQVFREMTAV